jgi:hypothetical protein
MLDVDAVSSELYAVGPDGFKYGLMRILLFLETSDLRPKKKKINGGQLLLTVTDKRQSRPLVREGAPQRQDSKIQTGLISGRKSN